MLSKKDLFNAKSASQELEEGLEINVKAVGTYSDTDQDGHDVTVSVLVDEDGSVYAGISATVADAIPMLDEILKEAEENGETVTVEVVKNTSKSGRKFTQLRIV